MAERSGDLDDARYEHHVKHRGQANHRLFWFCWFLASALILAIFTKRAHSWWNRRSHRKHRYVRLQPRTKAGLIDRLTALRQSISVSPFPELLGRTVTSLPLSRIVVITGYVLTVVVLLTSVDAPSFSAHYMDDIAFRAAWVSLTHIPFVYLLSTKRGPINYLAGVSYERINWLHRWIGRGLFSCATVHMAIMKSSISLQDILNSREEGMVIVRYGIAAYATLAWIAITSAVPLRRWNYQAFYINHWISTATFLFIVLQHVPNYARVAIHIAFSILVFDKVLTAYYFCGQNVTLRTSVTKSPGSRHGSDRGTLEMGYPIKMSAPSVLTSSLPTQTKNGATIIRISNIEFSWKPGQHVRLYIPTLGRFEMHPFTPANCSVMRPPPLPPRRDIERGRGRVVAHKQPLPTSEMLLVIKEKSGLTRRLCQYYEKWLALPCPNASRPSEKLSAYIDGPYGQALAWEEYEKLVLVSSSTGVSFCLAILDHLEQLCFTGSAEIKTKTITFIWTIRHIDAHLEETVKNLLLRYSAMVSDMDVELQAEFYTTCQDSKLEAEMAQYDPFAHLRHQAHLPLSSRPPLTIRHPDEIYEEWQREAEEMIGSDDASPFVPDTGSYNEWDEYEDDNSDETCTLVDEHEQRDQEDKDPFSDTHATSEHDSAYRPLPPPRSQSQPVTSRLTKQDIGCQCALIQHHRRKLNISRTDSGGLIVQNHGLRPNIQRILDEVVMSRSVEHTMIAVCANSRIANHARSVVATAKFDYAKGTRKGNVDIFIEGAF